MCCFGRIVPYVGLFLLAASIGWGAELFTDNGDGTITQNEQNLMWQQEDDGVERIWDDAISYCDALNFAGYTDWQLPKIHMLEALVEPGFSPTIAPVFKVKPSYYWSSSESRTSVKSAKYVNFFYGNTYAFSKDNTYYTLCVRDLAATKKEPLEASIHYEVQENETPFTTHFTSLVTGGTQPFFYEWDFGDGDFSSLSGPTHTYKEQGKYSVILTVSDNGGSLAVARQEVVFPTSSEIDQPLTEPLRVSHEIEAQETLHTSLETGSAGAMEVESSHGSGEEKSTEIKLLEPQSAALQEAAGDIPKEEEGAPLEEKQKSRAESQVPPDDRQQRVLVEEKGPAESIETQGKEQDVSSAEKVHEVAETAVAQTPTMITHEVIPAPPVIEEHYQPVAKTAGQAGQVHEGTGSHEVLTVFASKGAEAAQLVSRGQGFLAYAFANGISGDADWNKDGQVTARELKGYLGIAIDNLSGGTQMIETSMDSGDFPLCADGGVTHILVVGVDSYRDEGFVPVSFAQKSAELMAEKVSASCPNWKKLVLLGPNTMRNNIFRAVTTMAQGISDQDTFIFYFVGRSTRVAKTLLLQTYDTLADLPDLTGIDVESMENLLRTLPAAHSIMLFETGSHAE